MADEGYESAADSSFGDRAKSAAEDIPAAGSLVKAGFDASSGDIGSVGSDIASFASGASAVVEDPLNALISAGLSFLMDMIAPLKALLQQVTGNPDALDGANEDFVDIGKDISKLANDLTDIMTKGMANWSGDAKNAAAKQANSFISQVNETSNIAGNISMCLQLSGTLMDAAYNFVLGIISQCIEWLIVTWIAAQAAAFFTCGASEAAAGVASEAEVGAESANAADKVDEATTLVEKIVKIMKDLWGKLQNMIKYVGKMKDADKAAETAAKDGTKVASDASKVAKDGEKAAKDGEKAAGDASKAGEDANKSQNAFQKTYNAAKDKVQDKVNEAKENWNNKLETPGVHHLASNHQSFGDAMKDAGKDGAKDFGKDMLINSAGDAANRFQYAVQTQAPDQLPDGENQEPDPTMSGNLYE